MEPSAPLTYNNKKTNVMKARQIETIASLLSELPKDEIIKEITEILWAGKFTNALTEDIIGDLTQQTKK